MASSNKGDVAAVQSQRIKVEEETLTMSEEDIMRQVLATHAPSDAHVDVKSVFSIVENILSHATQIVDSITTGTQAQKENKEDKSPPAGFSAPSALLEDVSREMGYKALHGENAQKSTTSLLNMLSSYSWDAKIVLALASFAVDYGEFWLLTQQTSDQLAKSVAILKRIPAILKPSGSLKLGLISLNNLVKSVLEVARCIVLIEKLSIKYTVKEVPAFSGAMTRIPIYVYWTITTIVYCESQIYRITSKGKEYQASELPSFSHILTNINANLQKQLDEINQQIEENRAYQWLLKLHAHPTDNVEILRALICRKEDKQHLVHGSTRQMITIEELRKKNVLLHISSAFLPRDELNALIQTYNESKKADNQFEIVWIPMEKHWTEEAQQNFQSLRSEMPWYTVQFPSLIRETPAGRAAIKFIKQEWHYQNNTVCVSLDSQGRVQHPNAFYMIRIWGQKAYPFSNSKEEALWQQQRWSTELLLQEIYPQFESWGKEGKYIFLYGGTDLKWIQDFEEKSEFVATEAHLSLELLNLGKTSRKGERDSKRIQSFWTRLENLWFSKIQGHCHNEQDIIMQEIQKLVDYNKAGCWALLSKGPKVVINAHGSIVLSALWQFDAWKKNVSSKGFETAFLDYVELLLQADQGHKCRHFYFPTKVGKLPDHMKCPDCPRTMEKFITFQCCHDDDDVTTIC